MVWPDQSNHHGTLFGGAALAMLDRAAFILGSKVLRGPVVTAAVRQLAFMAPARAGCLVECVARVLRRGRRSVTIRTELWAEELLSGDRVICLTGEFVMVRTVAEGDAEPSVAKAPSVQEAKPCVQSRAMVAEIVFPSHANHRGVLHGGPAMAWISKAGFVAATREVRRTVVMAASERVDFRAPARVGDVVEVGAHVLSVGRRSIRVYADMWVESPTSGARRLSASVDLVYVVVEP